MTQTTFTEMGALTQFKNLNCGDWFLWEGFYFIKTDGRYNNAVRVNTGQLYSLNTDLSVTKISNVHIQHSFISL